MSDPLSTDPARQANASIAGYDYQLWYSVYAWCLLRVDEDLHLEGAEDLDILRGSTAETVQVKQMSRAITLASPEVREALTHWWENRERNPRHSVHLHFVTPATPTTEHGAPFGQDKPGLLFWEHVKRPGTDITTLKGFVHALRDLPQSFRDAIGRWSAEEFREQCVARIAWITSARSRSELRAAVERALVEQCDERYRTAPDVARRLAPHLHDSVVEAIVARSREPLTRASFLEALETMLTRRVAPIPVLGSAGAAITSLLGVDAERVVGAWAWTTPGVLVVADEAVSVTFVSRTELVRSLVEELSQHGALLLRGSTGMGKSTLARQVTKAFGGQWVRLDLRGREAKDIEVRLRAATSAVASSQALAGIVVDDLNFDVQPVLYENALIGLLQAIRLAHLNVIVTGHVDLPPRVALETGFRSTPAVPVSPLSEDETRELAERHGCPHGPESETWGRLVHVLTRGHPQLAHARACRLRDEGWPASGEAQFASLTEPSDLAAVQREARQRLAEEIGSPEARRLAYSLSLFIAPFTRDRALRMSDAINPGELFDRLCGPWIEAFGVGGEYRVSPLLQGAAEQAFDKDTVRASRRRICDTILESRALSSRDFAEVVFQAFVASYDRGLATAALASRQIPSETSRQILGSLLWLPSVQLTPGEALFEGNPVTSVFMRDLQFRTAVATGGDTVGQIVLCWDHELRGLDSRVRAERKDEEVLNQVRTLRGRFLLQALWTLDTRLPPEQAAKYGSEFLRFVRAPPPSFPMRALEAEEGSDVPMKADTMEAVIRHSQGAKPALALVEALARLAEEGDETLLDEFRRDERHAVILLTSAFIGAATQDPPLDEVTALTDAAIRLGHDRSVPALVAAAWRTKAVYHWECSNDSARALAVLDAGGADAGGKVPLLDDYRARVLAGSGREQEALDIWGPTPNTMAGDDWVRIYSAREAGMAASRLGRHADAAPFYAMAETLARRLNLLAMAVGLVGEQALEAWRAGDRASTVSAFARALGDLPSLPDPEGELRSRNAHKTVGHAVLWCLRQTPGSGFFGETRLVEPQPGWLCPLTPAEAMRSLPLGPLADVWGALAALEMDCDLGDTVYAEWCSRWSRDAVHSTGIVVGARARWALRAGKVAELVGLGSQLFDSFVAVQAAQRAQGTSTPQSLDLRQEGARSSFVVDLLAVATVSGVERDPLAAPPFGEWRDEACRLEIRSDQLDAWLDAAEGLWAGARNALAVASGAAGSERLRASAAALLASRAKNAGELFVASATLIAAYRQSVWRRAIEGAVDRLIVREWTKLIAEQRCSLVAPALAAPAIERACHDEGCSGLKRASRILLAAGVGVGGIPRWAASMLNELAE